ncbi:uncharacterized protein UV8b_02955 [Ustilaginoidea virens]|uniref:Uncharacterized protein n=1 Tax=Ustilaginoidea virens TaxID=1159556 RepID=A0A063C1Z7_USTVR|nr:uncharacterized protein UV8b_02955 [Ustilaginoidea virens]QUC18714.1 hypothetical protein UV8b_02955 [Ustilaginoidea virens]GAO15556.1 hypothetical protein UVI_02020340 [Ustilaginoidea virens]
MGTLVQVPYNRFARAGLFGLETGRPFRSAPPKIPQEYPTDAVRLFPCPFKSLSEAKQAKLPVSPSTKSTSHARTMHRRRPCPDGDISGTRDTPTVRGKRLQMTRDIDPWPEVGRGLIHRWLGGGAGSKQVSLAGKQESLVGSRHQLPTALASTATVQQQYRAHRVVGGGHAAVRSRE